MDPDEDAVGPVQMIDAGDVPPRRTLTAEERAQQLGEAMATVLAAASVSDMASGLADLASGLVQVDALVLEVPRPSTERTPRVLVHQGLRPDEVAAYARSTGSSAAVGRFRHRVLVDVAGVGIQAGRLVLWRTARSFDDDDRERANLAGTCAGVLVAQYLRQHAAEQQTRWSLAVEDIANVLAGRIPAAAALRVVVDRIREVSQCDLVWLGLGRDSGVVLEAISGADADRFDQRELQTPPSLTSQVIASGEAVQIDDLAEYARRLDLELAPSMSRLGPTLIEPVRGTDRVVGGLGLAWRADQAAAFLSMDPALPARFVDEVELTLRLGRVRADAERLAVLEERERIRLDLHDRVVQRLYALGTALESARLTADRSSVDQLLDHAVDRVDESIGEIRRVIAGLSLVDEGLGLYDAMASVIGVIAASAPFHPELRVVGLTRARVEQPVADDVLAVLEEALSNVVRHALASRCRVTLEVDGHVVLVIEDDGVGVPAGVSTSGLKNIERRAVARGGQLVVTDLGPGTRVTWSVPNAEPR